jgi:penicillin amidase
MERLRGWDGTLAAESPEAALFVAWYDETVRAMFEDDLGPRLFADYARTPNLAAKALDHAIQNGETTWCDDVRTPEPETCATLLARTLDGALRQMGERQGSADVGRWRWDRVNAAVFPHAVFDRVPLLQRAFSRRVPAGGHAFTINPVMPLRDDIYISSYRQIIDLAALDSSRFIIPAGQSGHVWSPQYDDLLPRWGKVEYLAMRFSREAVDAAQAHRLVLEPQ